MSGLVWTPIANPGFAHCWHPDAMPYRLIPFMIPFSCFTTIRIFEHRTALHKRVRFLRLQMLNCIPIARLKEAKRETRTMCEFEGSGSDSA